MHLTSMTMHYNKTVSGLTATIVLVPAGNTQRLRWASRLRSCLEHTLLTEIHLKCQVQRGLAIAPKINHVSNPPDNFFSEEGNSSENIILGIQVGRVHRIMEVQKGPLIYFSNIPTL